MFNKIQNVQVSDTTDDKWNYFCSSTKTKIIQYNDKR